LLKAGGSIKEGVH
jgi:hypothetical protein